MRDTTSSFDDEPCDYQKAGSCLVPGAVESDRDGHVFGKLLFWGNGKNGLRESRVQSQTKRLTFVELCEWLCVMSEI